MHQRRADNRVPGLRPVRQQHEPERHGVQLSVHRHARLRSSAIGAASAWRRTVQVVVRSGPLRCAPRPAPHTIHAHDETSHSLLTRVHVLRILTGGYSWYDRYCGGCPEHRHLQ